LHQIGFEYKLHLSIMFSSPLKVKPDFLNNLAYFERAFFSPILLKQPNFPPPHVTQQTTFWNEKNLDFQWYKKEDGVLDYGLQNQGEGLGMGLWFCKATIP